MSERVWLVERTRVGTDYQHVTAYSAAAAMEIAENEPPHKWLTKRSQSDDPNAEYVIKPVPVSSE